MNSRLVRRILISFVMVVYSVCILPGHFSTVWKYFSLKNKVHTVDLEIQALAGTLMSAKDVDTVVKNSGFSIKLCSIMESVDNTSLRSYNGEDLEDLKPRVLEYIIEIKDDVNYLLSYLSNYNISYANISVLEEEMILKIYCN